MYLNGRGGLKENRNNLYVINERPLIKMCGILIVEKYKIYKYDENLLYFLTLLCVDVLNNNFPKTCQKILNYED